MIKLLDHEHLFYRFMMEKVVQKYYTTSQVDFDNHLNQSPNCDDYCQK